MKIELNATYFYTDSFGKTTWVIPVEFFKNGNIKVKVKSGKERKYRLASFMPAQLNNYTKIEY